MESDVISGGECSIFELLDVLKKALPSAVSERLLPQLIPDFMLESKTDEQMLEFCVLKIIHRVAKKGINMK